MQDSSKIGRQRAVSALFNTSFDTILDFPIMQLQKGQKESRNEIVVLFQRKS